MDKWKKLDKPKNFPVKNQPFIRFTVLINKLDKPKNFHVKNQPFIRFTVLINKSLFNHQFHWFFDGVKTGLLFVPLFVLSVLYVPPPVTLC